MNVGTRKKLTETIEMEHGNNWWKPELFLEKIKHLLPSELEIVENPPSYELNYNCFVYVFGLEKDEEFLGGKNPIQQGFVKHLMWDNFSGNILEETKTPEVGDFVFYEDNEKNITHGAIYQGNDFVVSKWMWGPIIKNKILDMPSSFGDKVIYCKKVRAEVIKGEYLKYKDTGVEIPPIS